MKLSIVLGSYNRKDFLISTINSVRANNINHSYEIIVVDGGSTDGSINWLNRQKDIITIVQHNRGKHNGVLLEKKSWGYFMNLGFKCASGKYILMISDDCLLIPNSVDNGINQFDNLLSQRKKIGALAFYWRNWPEMEKYWVGTTFGKIFVNHGIYLKEALIDVGWINESDYSFYHADGDLSLKMWSNGYEILEADNSFIEHFSHANLVVRKSNENTQSRDWDSYVNHWRSVDFEGVKYDSDWLYKSYEDKYGTYKNFPKWELIKFKVRMFFKRINFIL
jgi:glycosyltransferase involved in cell wall biosynthesis